MTSLEVEEQSENLDDMFEFVDIVPKDITPLITEVEDFEDFKNENLISELVKEDLSIKEETGENNNLVPIKGRDKKYSCPHCDYKTRRGDECQEHINGVHQNLKPYVCIF